MTRPPARRKRRTPAGVMRKVGPGDIVAYRRRSRNKREILCHNHVAHTRWTPHGENGFRWFVAHSGGSQWKVCPCGWRPDLGVHYADLDHVKFWRDLRKRLGSQEAVDRHIRKLVFSEFGWSGSGRKPKRRLRPRS
jgi:hypothetical protein